jgi:hypothetical protein
VRGGAEALLVLLAIDCQTLVLITGQQERSPNRDSL